MVLVLILLAAIVSVIVLYRRPAARQKVADAAWYSWSRLTACSAGLFGRRRGGRGSSTFLVGEELQEPAWGSILEDDQELLVNT